MLAQMHADHQAEQEAEGRRLYWQGRSRYVCVNPAQRAGWEAAEADDERGWRAYIAAMSEAEADGEAVNWSGVWSVMDDAADLDTERYSGIPSRVINGEWVS